MLNSQMKHTFKKRILNKCIDLHQLCTVTLAVYSMWLCNVVAMFSYANILFAQFFFANPALVAYKPVLLI